MLKKLDAHGIKVLITVDEVINSKNVRALQNDKSQTFLRRAPKIQLGALNLTRILNVIPEEIRQQLISG